MTPRSAAALTRLCSLAAQVTLVVIQYGGDVGIFDGFSNAGFKKDSNGVVVYFPWGVFGKGRELPDKETEARIRKFNHRYFQSMFTLTLLTYLLFEEWYLLIPFLMVIVHYVGMKRLIADLSYSKEKLTLGDSFRGSADGHSLALLWLLFISSVCFLLISISMLLSFTGKGPSYMGLLVLTLSGTGVIMFGLMIRRKKASVPSSEFSPKKL